MEFEQSKFRLLLIGYIYTHTINHCMIWYYNNHTLKWRQVAEHVHASASARSNNNGKTLYKKLPNPYTSSIFHVMILQSLFTLLTVEVKWTADIKRVLHDNWLAEYNFEQPSLME